MSDAGARPPGGRVVVVTGGTRGIGRTIASRFLDAGDHVLVCGRHECPDPPRGRGGGLAVAVQADVRDHEQAGQVVQAAVQRWGRLDVLVNNAGGSPTADAATASPRLVTSVVGLNLLAPFFLAQHAYAVMHDQDGGGLVLNVGSVAATNPQPGTAAYSAAKAGLAALTRALALEWGPRVRVAQVTPGLVLTELSEQYYGSEQDRAELARAIPAGRMATPDDIAAACLMLASPDAAYVSGAELLVHGGGEQAAREVLARRARERD